MTKHNNDLFKEMEQKANYKKFGKKTQQKSNICDKITVLFFPNDFSLLANM